MNKTVLIVLFLVLNLTSFSQINGEDEVYLSADLTNPKFNGGDLDKFYEFVNKNFDFTKVTKAGKLIAGFTINELGELKNIKVIQFVDVITATEIIRVLKLSPKWQPAMRNGKATSVDLKLPLDFKTNTIEKAYKQKEIAQHKTVDSLKFQELLTTSKSRGLESKPEYVGGMKAFSKYIANNFNMPSSKDFKGGKLLVQFVVEKDGTLTDFKILTDIGFGTAQEAIRVLQKSPMWIPAQQDGKLVRCSYTLPITLSGN